MGSVSLAVKKYLSNKYCVEVKDESYLVHLTQSKVLREHKGSKFSRAQYKNYLETKIGRNQKVNTSNKGKLKVKSQPKKEIRQKSTNLKLVNTVLVANSNLGLNSIKDFCVKNVNIILQNIIIR